MTTAFVLDIALFITFIVWTMRARRRNVQRRVERAKHIAT